MSIERTITITTKTVFAGLSSVPDDFSCALKNPSREEILTFLEEHIIETCTEEIIDGEVFLKKEDLLKYFSDSVFMANYYHKGA